MNKKGYSVRFFAIAILFSLIFATAVGAFVKPYYENVKENENLIPNISGMSSSPWQDDFNDETKIDPSPPGSGESDNYDVADGKVSMINTYSAWTDPFFTKMKILTLTNNEGSPLTNHPLKLIITYDSDMDPDYEDIRFKHENNPTTWLDYWIESYDTSSAIVWVKISNIPTGQSEMYLFYGNPSASSDSDFSGIFSWSYKWAEDEKVTNHLDKEGTWDPDVCFDSDDNEFIVAWEEGQAYYPPYTWGFKQEIRASIYDDTGTRLVNDKLIYNDGTTFFRNEDPTIAFGAGKFFNAWERYATTANPDATTMDIYGRTVSRSGTGLSTGTLRQISTATDCQADPNVEFDSVNNKFCVVWEDARNGMTNYDLYGRIYNSDGSPYTSEIVISNAADSQTEPWITFDPVNEQYMIVWEEGENAANGPFDIWVGIFDDGLNQIGSTQKIADGDTDTDYNFPCVSFDEDTELYLVTYNSGDISDGDYWGNVYGIIFDSSLTTVVDTFTISSGDYVRTDIVNYYFDFFFVSYDDNQNIYGKLVSPDGDIMGSELQLSIGNDPDMKADWANIDVGNGKIFVAWEDIRDDYPPQYDFFPDVYANMWNLNIPDGSEVSYVTYSENDLILSAHVTSIEITPSNLRYWDEFDANYGNSITFQILDGATGTVLMNPVYPGDSIQSITASSIRLMATFSRTNPSISPYIDWWSASWIENQPPNAPSNPDPYDGETGVLLDDDLSWDCSDPESDPLTYDVYFGTSSPPPLVASGQSATTYEPSTMSFGTTYYWKIVAEDSYGATTEGPIWDFTTEVNNPPNIPSSPSPPNGAINVDRNADLSWTGGDPDGDSVTYDVYFGTTNPPPQVGFGQTTTTYDPGTLNFNTLYYWKIVAEDEHGATTSGPLWSFTTKANNPPNTPGSPNPANGAIDVDLNSDLSWTGGDPDGDSVTYDVYFGTSSPPPLVSSGQSETTFDPGTMNYNTLYYWKIVAFDEHGASTSGPIWSFTTEINNPPNIPGSPNPANGATDVGLDADLSWTCSDPDGDPLTYDVYFGTSSPPPLVASGQSATSYDPGIMSFGTTYYWKIVAEDNHGASTSGPVWSYTTEVNNPPNPPSSPDPADGETNVGLNDDLSWTGGDPDGDSVTYDVYFGTSSPPPLVSSGQSGTTYDPGTMSFGTTYYWRIIAEDEHGATTTGSIWDFSTEVNNPPNIPSSPNPTDGEIDVELDADLSWTGGDPNGDTVTYDVYFGDSSPPPLVSSGQSGTTFDPGTLTLCTTYYWQIVAEDEHGATTTGPIWDFTTRCNSPPNIPSNPDPADGEIDVALDADLSWTCSDPEGDPLTYDVYFGDTTPPPLVASGQSETTYEPGNLDHSTLYYWKIIAEDTYGETTDGPIWSFTTIGNHPPNTPYNPSPNDGAIEVDTNADLSWSGGDPDPGDTVVYDVYFGTTSPPSLVSFEQSGTTYDPGTLAVLSTYYWKIVAKDNNGAETEGPIWSFITRDEFNSPPGIPSIRSISHPNGIIIIRPNQVYEFEVVSNDPDGDDVYYYVEWGDGESDDWDGPHGSGVPTIASHTWSPGFKTGTIQVKAKDTENDESGWGTLSYIVLNEKSANKQLFPRLQNIIQNFLESHPRLEAFITQLFDRFLSRFENPEIVDSTEQIVRLVHQ